MPISLGWQVEWSEAHLWHHIPGLLSCCPHKDFDKHVEAGRACITYSNPPQPVLILNSHSIFANLKEYIAYEHCIKHKESICFSNIRFTSWFWGKLQISWLRLFFPYRTSCFHHDLQSQMPQMQSGVCSEFLTSYCNLAVCGHRRTNTERAENPWASFHQNEEQEGLQITQSQ